MGKDNKIAGDYIESNDSDRITVPITTKKETKFVSLTFRYNRSYDLHIGRHMYNFKPCETRKDIPAKIIDHKDFENVKNYFVINGV